ncbi:MAG: hypothetical protein ACFFB2_14270 [Promethearchaeota archaeon]
MTDKTKNDIVVEYETGFFSRFFELNGITLENVMDQLSESSDSPL